MCVAISRFRIDLILVNKLKKAQPSYVIYLEVQFQGRIKSYSEISGYWMFKWGKREEVKIMIFSTIRGKHNYLNVAFIKNVSKHS